MSEKERIIAEERQRCLRIVNAQRELFNADTMPEHMYQEAIAQGKQGVCDLMSSAVRMAKAQISLAIDRGE